MFRPILSATLAVALGTGAALAMSDDEHAAALRALDDEFAAYATYTAILDKFGQVQPFVSVHQAEAKHIAAISDVLAADGIEVPQNPYLNGEKPAPQAPASVQEACAIGVQAEIANAALYDDELLPQVAGNPELTQVFASLRDASQNHHLPAFEACAQ